MRRRRAVGSTRLACALRGRFFCFLLSRAGRSRYGGFPRPRPRCGLFATAEDSQAARGPAGAEMGRIFCFLLPGRLRFRASRGLGAPKSLICAGFLAAAESRLRRRARSGGRISAGLANYLRKTLPLAGPRPSFSRQCRPLDRGDRPARSEPPIQRHRRCSRAAIAAGRRRPPLMPHALPQNHASCWRDCAKARRDGAKRFAFGFGAYPRTQPEH